MGTVPEDTSLNDTPEQHMRLSIQRRILKVQKLNLKITWLSGIVLAMHLLQSLIYTPKPWILTIFLAMWGIVTTNQLRIRSLMNRLRQFE